MKIIIHGRPVSGYALIMVLSLAAVAIITLAATVSRTMTNSKLNDRSNQYMVGLNAAESATEKVVARMKYDFQKSGGGMSTINANMGIYRGCYPSGAEDPYWTNFVFSDAQGNNNATYVGFLSNYVGNLPSQYPGLYLSAQSQSPVYRIISNVKAVGGNLTVAVQEDFLLALVPINQYAIFYNGLLEFSTAATMTINGVRKERNQPTTRT